MAVFIFVALVITAIHKFVVEAHLTRTLTECYWAGHADVAHLTAADPRFYCMQIRLTKACMDERGYVFDDIATSEILAARSNAAPAMSLALLAQLEQTCHGEGALAHALVLGGGVCFGYLGQRHHIHADSST